jgi:hypothetical protein
MRGGAAAIHFFMPAKGHPNCMAKPAHTPLGALLRGVAAGAIGIAALTAHQELVMKLQLRVATLRQQPAHAA